MARARGANAQLAIGYETSYGVPPGSGFRRTPFVSANLGETQGLIESDLLGFGREPQQPGRDAIDNAGDIVVPLCARNIGLWLKLLFGAPTTTPGLVASGSIVFAAQPAANSTITIAGQAFTFVAANPTANQILIGTTLADTLANAVRVLNTSAVAAVTAARYGLDAKSTTIQVTHKTPGTAGNAFTLASTAGTASGATLSGGAASGAFNHVFTSGLQTLPSASIEVGLPEVPSYAMNYGLKANTLAIQLARGGNLNATIGMIGQGENPTVGASAAGSPTELAVQRFSNFSGLIRRLGVPIADVVTGQLNFGNGMEGVPAIRGDGRVSGVDEGGLSIGGQVGVRYGSTDLQTLAENGTPNEFDYGWAVPNSIFALLIQVHEVYLPKAKRAITGPTGVQVDYAWQGAEQQALQRAVTVTLINDVANYN